MPKTSSQSKATCGSVEKSSDPISYRTNYPSPSRLGPASAQMTVKPFSDPPTTPDTAKSSSRSQYVGELLTNPHARFPTLTANIRERRGSLVDIRVPLCSWIRRRSYQKGISVPLSNGEPSEFAISVHALRTFSGQDIALVPPERASFGS